MKNFIKAQAYRAYKHLEIKEHSLKYLFLEITRRCNLSCRHCGSDCSSDPSMSELPLEKWIEIIDYIADNFSPFIVITGGEPFVSPNFYEIVGHLKKRGLPWGVVTNGMTLNKESLKQSLQSGMRSMTISLDGTPDAHKYLRKRDDGWSRALESVILVANSPIKVMDVVTCVFPENLKELDFTAKTLIDAGVKNWRLFRIFPKGAAADNPNLALSFDESRELVEWISSNREHYNKRGLNISFSCEGYLPFAKDIKIRDEPFFCRAGVNIASILADGSITGCNNNGEDFYQGSIITDDFKTVWSERFKEYRHREWLKTGICKGCKEWNQCQGGSIHLREKDSENPLFCYVKRVT